jgi:hypothetical protein
MLEKKCSADIADVEASLGCVERVFERGRTGDPIISQVTGRTLVDGLSMSFMGQTPGRV